MSLKSLFEGSTQVPSRSKCGKCYHTIVLGLRVSKNRNETKKNCQTGNTVRKNEILLIEYHKFKLSMHYFVNDQYQQNVLDH